MDQSERHLTSEKEVRKMGFGLPPLKWRKLARAWHSPVIQIYEETHRSYFQLVPETCFISDKATVHNSFLFDRARYAN